MRVYLRGAVKGSVTAVQCEFVMEWVASNRVQVDPDIVEVIQVDRVGEVDLVGAPVDTFELVGDLDGDTRIEGGPKVPSFSVLAMRLERNVLGE